MPIKEVNTAVPIKEVNTSMPISKEKPAMPAEAIERFTTVRIPWLEREEFDAAIFDLDGTLIDSFNAWKDAARKALAAINHTLTDEEFDKMYLMTTEETNEHIRNIYESNKQEIGEGITFDSVIDIVDSEMEKKYGSEVTALPSALRFVRTMHESNVPICVATLTPNRLAEKALTQTGFMPYVKFIITGDDVGRSKRFPHIFKKAAKRLGHPPSKTVVFEDCPTAIKTAHKAGFIVCRVEDEHQNYDGDISKYYAWSIKNYAECLHEDF